MAQADTSIIPAVGDEPQPPPASPRSPNRRLIWVLLLTGLAVFLLAYIIAAITAGSGVPRGTTVLGVNIGGMSRTEAVQTLRAELPARLPARIQVTAADKQIGVKTSDAGLAVDYVATVSAAGTSSLNPIAIIKKLTSDTSVDPVVTTTGDGMQKTVARIAKQVRQKPSEGAIDFGDGTPRPIEPKPGRELDAAGTRTVLRAAYGDGTSRVEVPVKVAPPSVDAAEVQRAMEQFGRPAVDSSVTLQVAGHPLDVPVPTFAPYLSTRPVKGELTLVMDGAGLRDALARRLAPYEERAQNASFRIVGGKPQVVPAVSGREVAPAELAAAVVAVLPKSADRVASVTPQRADPEITTEEARQLGVTEKISSWTTNFPFAAYRAHNISRASRYLNGALVLPNKEFSFNQRIGERTAARGFVAGVIIGGGGSFDKDLGGGVSAVATTTFNAIFYAGLRDLEHHPHSFWIPRYPKGTEATVFWGSKDLRFLNDSGNGVFITASSTNTSVTVTFWGTKKYSISRIEGPERNVKPYDRLKRDRCVPQEGMRGFDITTWRVFSQNGHEVRREQFNTHYVPADEITCKEEIHP
jgi:vancomycin resistance protein YoaR